MFDMSKMMGKLQEAQGKMQQIQAEMGKLTTDAETGGGMVKVTVNGHKQITKLEIEDELMKPEEREMLQDLVSAAVNRAMSDMEAKVKEEMARRSQELLPNIPGLDLNNMMGGGK